MVVSQTSIAQLALFSDIYCPYSVQMRENADQNNSEYGHFSRSGLYAIVFVVDFEHAFVGVGIIQLVRADNFP